MGFFKNLFRSGQERRMEEFLKWEAEHPTYPPLLFADEDAETVSVDKIRARVAGEAELLLRTNVDGQTPLHWAAICGNKPVAEFLLAGKAPINAAAKDGKTPLHEAALMGDRAMVELLLAHQADINAKDNDDQTPMDLAHSQKHNEIIKMLDELSRMEKR